jgi:hypothetical protein
MPYYDVANLVTVTKTNMIDEMPCGYGTLRTTGVRIRHQVSRRPAQRSPQLQNLTILIVKSRSILNAPPSLQVLSGAWENALAQSESILQSSRGGWEHLEVHRSTGEGYRSVERFAYGFRTELHFADVLSVCVRGSPLAVIMGLARSRGTAHTTLKLASTPPSDMPFSGGSYRSQGERLVVSR